MAKKRRTLSPEDRAIWAQFSKSLTPLHQSARDTGPVSQPKADAVPRCSAPIVDFSIGARVIAPAATTALNLAPGPEDAVRAAPLRMDAKTFARMRRGKLAPDTRIDLHGMTAERAHHALTGFLLRAHSAGHRLALVITGKGRPGASGDRIAPHRQGVLRHAVPDWLSRPPLSQIVLQVAPAHTRHGGGGAYYVYLRRF